MGSNEGEKSSKSEKSPSPPQDQTSQAHQANIQVYPDWAALQAYYGPRVTVPPYYNSAVASGHAPHPYMWGPPQHMMSPYGTPYAAIYSHGNVYAHPAVTLGPQSQAHGVPSSPITAVTPLNAETPKSTGNTNGGQMKKLKSFDGLTMSIGNGNSPNVDGGLEHMLSQSGESDASSDGSDVNMGMASQSKRKRSREGTPTPGKDEKSASRDTVVIAGETNGASNKVVATSMTSSCVMGKLIGPLGSPSMSTALELKNPASTVLQTCPVLPENWMQNERELKRERRKQSNRESARRSRLRKQAEAEELGQKVEGMIAENDTIRSEIHRLTENSEKLKQENSTLLEKLKTVQSGRKRSQPEKAENLLSRVNNSDSVERNIDEENNMYKKTSNSDVKLRQLLGASPRTDAVAAG